MVDTVVLLKTLKEIIQIYFIFSILLPTIKTEKNYGKGQEDEKTKDLVKCIKKSAFSKVFKQNFEDEGKSKLSKKITDFNNLLARFCKLPMRKIIFAGILLLICIPLSSFSPVDLSNLSHKAWASFSPKNIDTTAWYPFASFIFKIILGIGCAIYAYLIIALLLGYSKIQELHNAIINFPTIFVGMKYDENKEEVLSSIEV